MPKNCLEMFLLLVFKISLECPKHFTIKTFLVKVVLEKLKIVSLR